MSFWWPDTVCGNPDSRPLTFELFFTFKSIYCMFYVLFYYFILFLIISQRAVSFEVHCRELSAFFSGVCANSLVHLPLTYYCPFHARHALNFCKGSTEPSHPGKAAAFTFSASQFSVYSTPYFFLKVLLLRYPSEHWGVNGQVDTVTVSDSLTCFDDFWNPGPWWVSSPNLNSQKSRKWSDM